MSVHTLTAFTNFARVNTGTEYNGVFNPATALGFDTGTIHAAANGDGLTVQGDLVDTGVLASDTITSVIFAFDWAITSGNANGGATFIYEPGTASLDGPHYGTSSGTHSEEGISFFGGAPITRATLFTAVQLWQIGIVAKFNGSFSAFDLRVVISNPRVTVTDAAPDGHAPSLDTIQPTSGAATGGDTVTLRGHGFTAASVPTFDGTAATNIVVASTNTLTCTPPPHAIGSVDVAVPGCGTLVNAFRYTARADTSNVIIAGSAPNLPPIPAGQSPVDPRTNKIDTMWLRWLNAVKQRVEAVVGADASQIISGLFSVAQIPTLPWSKIDKAGSSLADLTTRNAGDLSVGTLPGARMPALSGAVTTIAGSPITRIPNLPVFWPPDGDGGDAVIIPGPAGATGATGATGPAGAGGGGVTIYGCDGQDGDWIPIPGPAGPGGIVVAASLFHSAGQTLTHGTEATLSFDSADYDGSGLHSTVTNTSRITIPAGMAGIYALKGRVTFSTSLEGVVHVRAYKNGGVTPIAEHSANGSGLSTGNEAHELTVDVSLAVSDFVEIKVLVELAAGSGTISTISGSGKTQFQARSAGSIGGGGLPVTTAKGDLLASNGSTFVNVGAGSNTNVLTADSTQPAGVKWAAAATASAGALVLLEEHTASASTSLDFTTRNVAGQSGATFQTDYDEYAIEIVGFVNGSAAIPRIRCSTDGGSTYDSGANYDWGWDFHFSGTPGSIFLAGDTSFAFRNTTTTLATSGSWSGSLRLYAPGSALFKSFLGSTVMRDGTSGLVIFHGAGQYKSTTAVNAMRVDCSAGTITSGTIRVYGVSK